MALPEVVPIRTSDRVTFELRAVTRDKEIAPGISQPVEEYDWFAVARQGDRLAAVVSPIGYLDLRRARSLEDATARVDKFVELARVEVFFKGESRGDANAIPEMHIYSLAAKINELSSVGSDPFGVAPVASPPLS